MSVYWETVNVIVAEWIWVSACTMLLRLTSIQENPLLTRSQERAQLLYTLWSLYEYKIRARTRTTEMVMTPDFSSSVDHESLTFTHWGVLLNPNPVTSDASCVNNTHTHTVQGQRWHHYCHLPRLLTRLTIINHGWNLLHTQLLILYMSYKLTLNPVVFVFSE